MQLLSCDMWLIDRQVLSGFLATMKSIPFSAEMAKASAAVSPRREKNVAVIPVHGVIEARPSMIGEALGMPSYERIGQVFDSVMADDSIGSVIFDIASPGGMAYGAQELGQKIFEARGRKPMIAFANPLMASGALWPFAAADRIVGTESADIGSVGVITEHVDISQALANEGEKVTTVRSTNAPHKGEMSNTEPLTDEAKAYVQKRADAIHNRFAGDLAKYRGVSVEHVNEHFGKGRIMNISDAIRVGMADRVGSLHGVARMLMQGRVSLGSTAAMDQWDTLKVRVEEIRKVATSFPVEIEA